MIKYFDVTYCTEIKEEVRLLLGRLRSCMNRIVFFIGEGEATGVSGEGVCTGGGAYCCQSGGKNVASRHFYSHVLSNHQRSWRISAGATHTDTRMSILSGLRALNQPGMGKSESSDGQWKVCLNDRLKPGEARNMK